MPQARDGPGAIERSSGAHFGGRPAEFVITKAVHPLAWISFWPLESRLIDLRDGTLSSDGGVIFIELSGAGNGDQFAPKQEEEFRHVLGNAILPLVRHPDLEITVKKLSGFFSKLMALSSDATIDVMAVIQKKLPNSTREEWTARIAISLFLCDGSDSQRVNRPHILSIPRKTG